MRVKRLPAELEAFRLPYRMTAETPGGTIAGEAGDWLIIGVEGEIYFCTDSVFQKVYAQVIKAQRKSPNYKPSALACPLYYAHIKKSPSIEECLVTLFQEYPKCTATPDQVTEIWKRYHPLDLPPVRPRGRPPREKTASPDRDPPPPDPGDKPAILDAKGKQVVIGARVKQVAGKSPAAGIGEVRAVSQDGKVNVRFLSNIKVLPASHFEVMG